MERKPSSSSAANKLAAAHTIEARLKIAYWEMTVLGNQQYFEDRVDALLKLGIAKTEVAHAKTDLKNTISVKR